MRNQEVISLKKNGHIHVRATASSPATLITPFMSNESAEFYELKARALAGQVTDRATYYKLALSEQIKDTKALTAQTRRRLEANQNRIIRRDIYYVYDINAAMAQPHYSEGASRTGLHKWYHNQLMQSLFWFILAQPKPDAQQKQPSSDDNLRFVLSPLLEIADNKGILDSFDNLVNELFDQFNQSIQPAICNPTHEILNDIIQILAKSITISDYIYIYPTFEQIHARAGELICAYLESQGDYHQAATFWCYLLDVDKSVKHKRFLTHMRRLLIKSDFQADVLDICLKVDPQIEDIEYCLLVTDNRNELDKLVELAIQQANQLDKRTTRDSARIAYLNAIYYQRHQRDIKNRRTMKEGFTVASSHGHPGAIFELLKCALENHDNVACVGLYTALQQSIVPEQVNPHAEERITTQAAWLQVHPFSWSNQMTQWHSMNDAALLDKMLNLQGLTTEQRQQLLNAAQASYNLTVATHALQLALEDAKQIEDIPHIASICVKLARAYEKDDPNQAQGYLRQAIQYGDYALNLELAESLLASAEDAVIKMNEVSKCFEAAITAASQVGDVVLWREAERQYSCVQMTYSENPSLGHLEAIYEHFARCKAQNFPSIEPWDGLLALLEKKDTPIHYVWLGLAMLHAYPQSVIIPWGKRAMQQRTDALYQHISSANENDTRNGLMLIYTSKLIDAQKKSDFLTHLMTCTQSDAATRSRAASTPPLNPWARDDLMVPVKLFHCLLQAETDFALLASTQVTIATNTHKFKCFAATANILLQSHSPITLSQRQRNWLANTAGLITTPLLTAPKYRSVDVASSSSSSSFSLALTASSSSSSSSSSSAITSACVPAPIQTCSHTTVAAQTFPDASAPPLIESDDEQAENDATNTGIDPNFPVAPPPYPINQERSREQVVLALTHYRDREIRQRRAQQAARLATMLNDDTPQPILKRSFSSPEF